MTRLVAVPATAKREADLTPAPQGRSNPLQCRGLRDKGFQGAVVGFACSEGGDFLKFNDSADIVQA